MRRPKVFFFRSPAIHEAVGRKTRRSNVGCKVTWTRPGLNPLLVTGPASNSQQPLNLDGSTADTVGYISLLLTKVTQAGMELFVETHRSENSDNDS